MMMYFSRNNWRTGLHRGPGWYWYLRACPWLIIRLPR